MREIMREIWNSILNILFMLVIGGLIIFIGVNIHLEYFSYYSMEKKVHGIYQELWIQSGQNQDRLPLKIIDNPTVNAYNNGQEIVIYTGLIRSVKNWDEVALILGHEIAHGNLGHLKMLNTEGFANDANSISVMEANADKMGAVYIAKAGYNICKAREIFKSWANTKGDYLGGDHPSYAYRYNELNFNCE